MRDAAADLEFEEAARLRDEIKRLEQLELAVADDPLAREPEGGVKGPASAGRPGSAARLAVREGGERLGGARGLARRQIEFARMTWTK